MKLKSKRALCLWMFVFFIVPVASFASDHDDGEVDKKGRALNLTDLYVFKESTQNSSAAATDLVTIMNTHPRGLPGYPYFWSTQARYEIHVTRVSDNTAAPSGSKNITFRYTFGDPSATDSSGTQTGTLTITKDGSEVGSGTFTTTSLAKSITDTDANLTSSTVTIGDSNFVVFAGGRQDPFFFDVENYFKIRALLLGLSSSLVKCDGSTSSGASIFNPDTCAVDFTKNYNVNSIVTRIPIAFLQSAAETNFDFWTTISLPK